MFIIPCPTSATTPSFAARALSSAAAFAARSRAAAKVSAPRDQPQNQAERATAKCRRELGLPELRIDDWRDAGVEDRRGFARTPQRACEHASRFADQLLERRARSRRSIERRIVLTLPPLSKRVSGNGRPEVPGWLAVTGKDDPHAAGAATARRRRILQASHAMRAAGKNTSSASCLS